MINQPQEIAAEEMKDSTEQTIAVVDQRLEAIKAKDIDAMVIAYTEDSVIFTPDGPINGTDNIRKLFDAFFAGPFAEVSSFEVVQKDCAGELGYLIWRADTAFAEIPTATDTFIIRDSKIAIQTVAAHIIPKSA